MEYAFTCMKRNKKDKGKERRFLDENKNFSCDKAKWLRKKIEREMRHWENILLRAICQRSLLTRDR